jgi:hypothetical protein
VKKNVLFSLLSAGALCVVPFAASAGAAPLNPAIAKTLSTVSVAGGGLHNHYAEWTGGLPNASSLPNSLDHESGNLGLFRFALSHRFPIGAWGEVRYDFGTGNTAYTGYTQSGAPASATTGNTVHDVRARVGYPFALTRNAALLPFLEGGYYRWDRTVDQGTPLAYDELYTSGYVGGGAKLLYAIAPNWVVSVTADAGSTVTPGIEASGLLRFSSAPGTHAYAGAALQEDYRVRAHWHLFARVSYRYFGFGRSDTVPATAIVNGSSVNATVTEPDSTTEQVRYSLGVAYDF